MKSRKSFYVIGLLVITTFLFTSNITLAAAAISERTDITVTMQSMRAKFPFPFSGSYGTNEKKQFENIIVYTLKPIVEEGNGTINGVFVDKDTAVAVGLPGAETCYVIRLVFHPSGASKYTNIALLTYFAKTPDSNKLTPLALIGPDRIFAKPSTLGEVIIDEAKDQIIFKAAVIFIQKSVIKQEYTIYKESMIQLTPQPTQEK